MEYKTIVCKFISIISSIIDFHQIKGYEKLITVADTVTMCKTKKNSLYVTF